MNIEKLICTEIELDGKKYKVVGVKFEKDNLILNVEEIKGSDLNGQIWENIWLSAESWGRIF